jgi:hypothetical protein
MPPHLVRLHREHPMTEYPGNMLKTKDKEYSKCNSACHVICLSNWCMSRELFDSVPRGIPGPTATASD